MVGQISFLAPGVEAGDMIRTGEAKKLDDVLLTLPGRSRCRVVFTRAYDDNVGPLRIPSAELYNGSC